MEKIMKVITKPVVWIVGAIICIIAAIVTGIFKSR